MTSWRVPALPPDGKRWAAPLVSALATTLVAKGERGTDEDVPRAPDAAR